ncbi:MAG: hypothetical protein ACN4GB_01100 [Candidatus Nanopelagicales bacterium]|nr:hypothetical protein [Actinomycetota bacterium]MBT5807552.1 hypothetical protein [Actinomycetota bacterium]MDA9227073.1 hypothetical protein [Actinomycetota bacterium]
MSPTALSLPHRVVVRSSNAGSIFRFFDAGELIAHFLFSAQSKVTVFTAVSALLD